MIAKRSTLLKIALRNYFTSAHESPTETFCSQKQTEHLDHCPMMVLGGKIGVSLLAR